MNKVIVIGNLGQDAQLGTTDSGRDWARFSMATNEHWKNSDGTRGQRTEWHQVVGFGGWVKTLRPLKKGSMVAVEGVLRYKKRTRDGVEYMEASIHATRVKFLVLKGVDEEAPAEPELEEEPGDDDIPF